MGAVKTFKANQGARVELCFQGPSQQWGNPDVQRCLGGGSGTIGFDHFRPGQREAVEILLEKRRLLLVAPTGGGKSLTYQLPTVFCGATIVISPLIALMHDQVQALEDKGISATFLASTLSSEKPGACARWPMGNINWFTWRRSV